ncbi:MAG: cytidylate kinase-like family protein [Clostridia bacterium]|nr:cytidylate kinase-like family protein [Clostridia bacterium]
MSHRIITISREFGSGGRTIGKEAAEKLGIPCYDQELIEKIAEDSGLNKDFIREKGEYAPRGSLFASSFFYDRSYTGFNVQDLLWQSQRKVILDLAEKGGCVIVGRCADYILQGKHDLLKVFVYASMEKREERILKVYGENEEAPRKRLEDKDKRRRAYYRLYTDMEWGQVQNYDIALNSGELGIEKCVDILTMLY